MIKQAKEKNSMHNEGIGCDMRKKSLIGNESTRTITK